MTESVVREKEFPVKRKLEQQVDHRSHVLLQDPKLPPFSGLKSKDTPFGRWKYEVRCLGGDRNYPSYSVLTAVRKSLRSPAADVVTRLGEHVSVEEVLQKFESIYGTVMSEEAILESFYSARQNPLDENEDCAAWCCRLEELAYQALEKDAVADAEIPGMLRNRFWSGLRDSRIKDALRQHRQKMAIEDLVKEARTLEEEFEVPVVKEEKPLQKPKAQQSAVAATDLDSKFDKILERLAQLEIEAAKGRSSGEQVDYGRGRGNRLPGGQSYNCGEEGHLAFGRDMGHQ